MKEYATKENFLLPENLEFKRHLGSGAYGLVCACVDKNTNEEVAVKRVNKVFDRKILTKRTLREIKMLRHFQGHENITCILDVFKFGEGLDFNEIYLVQELMEADLHQIIRSKQKLTNAHFQYFIYQILRGLKYMHSADILHRDLKPGNLLVNSDCELKICDFGLARGISEGVDHQAFMTEYVATRWYRAPEIMLSFRAYTKAIDIWSVGCIFAELLSGKVLFPGKDYVHQMSLIINISGTPDDELLSRIGSERAQQWIRSLPVKEKVPFSTLFPNADPLAIDLLEKLLTFDPHSRITVEEALKHEYLQFYHDENDEPVSTPMDFTFEKLETIEEMKHMIAQEINTYKCPERHSLQRKGSKSLEKPDLKSEPKPDPDYDNAAVPPPEADPNLERELEHGIVST